MSSRLIPALLLLTLVASIHPRIWPTCSSNSLPLTPSRGCCVAGLSTAGAGILGLRCIEGKHV